MACQHQTESLLADYVSGRLSSSQVADVERHLEDCPDCALALSQLQLLYPELTVFESEHIPDDVLVDFARCPTVAGEWSGADIRTHLAECPECRTGLQLLQAMNAESESGEKTATQPRMFVAALLSVAAILVILLTAQDSTRPAVDLVYVDTLPTSAFLGPLETRGVPDGGAEIGHEEYKDTAIRQFLQAIHLTDGLYQLQDAGNDPHGERTAVIIELRDPLGIENAQLEVTILSSFGPFSERATNPELWLMRFPSRNLYGASLSGPNTRVTVPGLGAAQFCGVLTWEIDGRIRTSSVNCIGSP